jgi:hypothetical protein
MADVDSSVWPLRRVDTGRYANISEGQCGHILCEFEIIRKKILMKSHLRTKFEVMRIPKYGAVHLFLQENLF